MSKHNYSQYSSKNNKSNSDNKPQGNNSQKHRPKPVVVENVKIPEITPEMETMPHPDPISESAPIGNAQEIVNGVVAHCSKLNVRENSTVNSAIVCVLDAMSEIQIDVNKSTDKWFYVCCANGAEGYCMKEYIDTRM